MVSFWNHAIKASAWHVAWVVFKNHEFRMSLCDNLRRANKSDIRWMFWSHDRTVLHREAAWINERYGNNVVGPNIILMCWWKPRYEINWHGKKNISGERTFIYVRVSFLIKGWRVYIIFVSIYMYWLLFNQIDLRYDFEMIKLWRMHAFRFPLRWERSLTFWV